MSFQIINGRIIADSNPVESTSDTTALVYDEILNAYVRPVTYDKFINNGSQV
jgi:hypothetical protein